MVTVTVQSFKVVIPGSSDVTARHMHRRKSVRRITVFLGMVSSVTWLPQQKFHKTRLISPKLVKSRQFWKTTLTVKRHSQRSVMYKYIKSQIASKSRPNSEKSPDLITLNNGPNKPNQPRTTCHLANNHSPHCCCVRAPIRRAATSVIRLVNLLPFGQL